MKTKEESTALAILKVGEYISECAPRDNKDAANAATLLMSVCAHAAVSVSSKQHVINLMMAVISAIESNDEGYSLVVIVSDDTIPAGTTIQ